MSVHYEINSKNISFLTAVSSSIKYCDGQKTWKFSKGLGLPELAHIGDSLSIFSKISVSLCR